MGERKETGGTAQAEEAGRVLICALLEGKQTPGLYGETGQGVSPSGFEKFRIMR